MVTSDALVEAQKETYPDTQLLFYFGPHDTENDALVFKDYLDSSDVYIPELPRATDSELKAIGRVGRGDQKAHERLKTTPIGQSPFYSKVMKMLLVRKPTLPRIDVVGLDIPPTRKWIDARNRLAVIQNLPHILDDADTNLSNFKDDFRELADTYLERDHVIAANITEYVEKRISSGKLPPNRPLGMLATYGYLHTPVYEEVQRNGVNATIVPESTIGIEDMWPFENLIVNYQSQQEASDTLLSHAYLSTLLQHRVEAASTVDRIKALRGIIEGFGEEQLRQFIENIAADAKKGNIGSTFDKIMLEATGLTSLNSDQVTTFLSREV